MKTMKDFAAVTALLLLGFFIGRAVWADEPQPSTPPTPAMVFGIRGCGIEVYWIAEPDGKVYRYDATHQPQGSRQAFLVWLESAPQQDIVILTNCPRSI